MLVNDDLSWDNSINNTFKEEKPGWIASQMFHSFGVMTPPGGLTGNWSVLEPPCSGTPFTEHMRFHISQVQFTMTVHSERDYLGEQNVCWRINWSQNLLDKLYSITERTTYVNITEGEVSGGDLSQCWGIIQCSLNICILTLIQYSSVLIAQEVTGSNHNAHRGLGGGQKVPKSKSYVRVPSQVNTALPQGGRQLLELRN